MLGAGIGLLGTILTIVIPLLMPNDKQTCPIVLPPIQIVHDTVYIEKHSVYKDTSLVRIVKVKSPVTNSLTK